MPTKKEYSLIEAIEVLGAEIDPKIDIVTVRVVGSQRSPIVRVYIDYPGGVDFDILQSTQNWISQLLDEIDPFVGQYTLEVSSPGLDRPLRKIEHFVAAIGKQAKVKTIEKINDRKSFSGQILSADDEFICLETEDTKYKIPFADIVTANLKGEI